MLRAAHGGYVDAVRVLIESGAGLDATAKCCLFALMLAIIGGHDQVAVAIIEDGANPTLRGCRPPGFDAKRARDLAHVRQVETVMLALDGR